MKAFFSKVIGWIKSKAQKFAEMFKNFLSWLKGKAKAVMAQIKRFAMWVKKNTWDKVFGKKHVHNLDTNHKVHAEGKGHPTPKQNKKKNGNKAGSKLHHEGFVAASA